MDLAGRVGVSVVPPEQVEPHASHLHPDGSRNIPRRTDEDSILRPFRTIIGVLDRASNHGRRSDRRPGGDRGPRAEARNGSGSRLASLHPLSDPGGPGPHPDPEPTAHPGQGLPPPSPLVPAIRPPARARRTGGVIGTRGVMFAMPRSSHCVPVFALATSRRDGDHRGERGRRPRTGTGRSAAGADGEGGAEVIAGRVGRDNE